MSFLPKLKVNSVVKNDEPLDYIDYILDKETMTFTVIGNEYESIKSWCEWAVKISRYKYEIFPYNYGNELYDELEGKIKSDNEIRDLVEYCIIDCLKVFQWIDAVEVRNIEINGTKINCKVFVKTVYGEEIEDEYNF